jgi:hypothetical protein
MKHILLVTSLFIVCISFSQRGSIKVIKKAPVIIDTLPIKKTTTYTLHYFEVSTSLGWKSLDKITGFNIKYGKQFAFHPSYNVRFGVDYENYIISNDYFKGSTLGYFLKSKMYRTNGYPYFWVPVSFTHRFGLKNKQNMGIKNYNEYAFGTGVGLSFREVFEIELNVNLRKPKAFVKRNTFITPSIHFTHVLINKK